MFVPHQFSLLQQDNDVQHRFNRINTVDSIEDIYDGLVYQEHMQDRQFLADANIISFLWNTDGVPVFKSSKCSIWLLYFVINELPIHKRWCKENVILGGLWFGETKPNMLTFLKPFTESISDLKINGVEVYSPDIQQGFKCHAMLLCGTCDLPAKAMVYNVKQYNGKHGCSTEWRTNFTRIRWICSYLPIHSGKSNWTGTDR